MKRFLLSNPANQKWVDAQERRKRGRDHVESVAHLVRREMFPELHLQSLQPLAQPNSTNSRIPSEIIIEARQRQLHRRLMKELLDTMKTEGNLGKMTSVMYRTMTWKKKSKAVFFYLHSSLGNSDAELTSSIFGVNINTFENWIRQKQYFEKWYHYVQSFTVADILPSIPSSYRDAYDAVDPASKVVIDPKFLVNSSGKTYVSSFSTGNRQMNQKLSIHDKTVVYMRKDSKTAGSGRKVKYQEQEEFIIAHVVEQWETGNPISKSSAYNILISKFGHESENDRTEWELKMGIHSGNITPALSQWLTRVLKRHQFSVRKESISQTVPINWLQVCQESTNLIRHTMTSAGVTRLVNADEMCLQFYPKDSHLIAPTNVNRVGSNRGEDDKKGCTVMVACEMFQSRLLAPFIIMTGVRNGTLSRRFANWDGPSNITFHPKHWMDKEGCCGYLEWLRSCYPEEKLGLIWDAATSHFCDAVVEKAKELNITLGAIPPGCTSLIQVCDLIANKPIKQAFKKRYVSWKIRSDPGPGGKYKVERSDVIQWLEEAFEEVDNNLASLLRISKAFSAYGQDHRSSDQTAFLQYLAKHEENGVYKSLLENQKCVDLE